MARDSVAARRKPARGDPSCVDGFTLHGDCSIGRVGVKAKGEPCSHRRRSFGALRRKEHLSGR